MSNAPPGIDPSSIGLSTIPVRQRFLDGRTIIGTEIQNRTNNTTLSLPNVQPADITRHSARQHVPLIADSVDWLPASLQRLAVSPSPVTRLPFEILAYIFELHTIPRIESAPAPTQEPFYLGQVCRFWRAVVESDPRLWTSIQFYFPETHQSREDDALRVKPVLDIHLKRSGTLPMSFTFTDHRNYQPASKDLIALLVDRLRTHAHRWKRISLHLPCNYFPLLLTLTPCDLSSLEHLHISGDVLPENHIDGLHLNLKSATKLKSFTFSGPGCIVESGIDLELHWETLAELSLEFAPHYGTSPTWSQQFSHLAQCQNLTTLSLGIDRSFQTNHQTLTLLRLETLRVRRLSSFAHARKAIDPLIVPQLQTLEIDASNLVQWNERWHHHTFSGLLERSRCNLRHLSIQDVDFSNGELVRCLALSHELISFRFIPCPRSQDIGDVIRRLDVSRTAMGDQTRYMGQRQGPLIPQLREITLASSVERCLDSMVEMFRSRVGVRAHAAGVAALRRADVVFFDMSHGTDVDRVHSLESRSRRVASFREELARWVSYINNPTRNEGEDVLETSVVVDSPYLAEYIDVR